MEETPSFSPDSLKKLSPLLLVAAILLAAIPVSSHGNNCGSVFSGVKDDFGYYPIDMSRLSRTERADRPPPEYQLDVSSNDACRKSLRTRRNITFTVAGIGIVLLVAGSINPAYSSKGIKNSSEGLEGKNNFCSQCGKQLDPEAQFCSTCGKRL